MSPTRVLVIEDDPDIRRSLELVLERAGYDPMWAPDGEKGLRCFTAERPDVVLLDVGLPDTDGWDVLEHIRRVSSNPVLLLTARGLESEKVRGLLGGADDYMTKPFSHAELLARIGALLRRHPSPAPEQEVYDDGVVAVSFARSSVTVSGRQVSLTPTEFRLLEVLVRHCDQVVSVPELLRLVWSDPSGSGTDRVKFTVMGLRRRLGWSGAHGGPLESVRGFGYRYRPPAPT
ncbi:MAG: response regulator transcription factor [Acidimicrobiales bacterium]